MRARLSSVTLLLLLLPGAVWLPVGLAFGYNYAIDEDLSIFAYTQPHYLLGRYRSGRSLARLRTRPDEALLKGNFALLLIGVESLFSSAPNASSFGLHLSCLRDKSQTATTPIPR